MTRVLLVRHGQSTWNADGRWQGQADPPLSELGERQAVAVAAAIVGPDSRLPDGFAVTDVWASPLIRALRTAEIIADALRLVPAVDPRFQEVNAGEWTGMTRAQIDVDWPGFLADHRRPPGFEPYEDLAARALTGLHEITAPDDGRGVIVVTHGGLVGAVERHLGAEWGLVPNLGGREIVRRAGGMALGDRFVLLDPDAVEVTTPRQI